MPSSPTEEGVSSTNALRMSERQERERAVATVKATLEAEFEKEWGTAVGSRRKITSAEEFSKAI